MLRGNWGIALVVGSIAAMFCGAAERVVASCNQIPGTVEIFRGASGSANRPFAGPGDFVELRAGSICHPNAGGFQADASEHVVSFIFTPPDGPASVVALAADCSSLAASLDRCAASASLAAITCIPHSEAAVETIERDGERRLQFRFPDTDALVDGQDDDRTLAGALTIAVTSRGDPLPCDLASHKCASRDDLPVCIDDLFALDGTCGDTPHDQFPHFTALPPPNDFQALCADPSPPCTGRQKELRFTTDSAGNLLVPIDWHGVLLGEAVPIARLLRGATSVQAFPNSAAPIVVPGKSFLRSFSPTGGPLPPIFEPQVDPSAPHELTLFGSADAAQTVLWLARRGVDKRTCRGGELGGVPCNEPSDCLSGNCEASVCENDPQRACSADSDCGSGECGAALFDFRSRAIHGIGPIVLSREGAGTCQSTGAPCSSRADCADEPCVTFRFRAEDPVPLEGLIQTPNIFVSVVPEAIAGRDLNGDGDQTDNVVLLHDRRTGVQQPIGEGAAPGRAATQLNQRPFVYPAVAVEDDVVAILEAEPLQGDRDANGDHDRFDSILRVFRSRPDGAEELTHDMNLVVEAAPLVAGRSVAISDGLVFFRTAEAGQTPRHLRRVSVSSAGTPANASSHAPVLSGDGRHIAFQSAATNLSPDAPVGNTVYLHDRTTGVTTPLRIDSPITDLQSPTLAASLSQDGRYVATAVRDHDGISQIFVQDRDADEDGIFDEPDAVRSQLISVNSLGDVGKRDSSIPTLSADGRFVAFGTLSIDLLKDIDDHITPFQNLLHLLVHDRDGLGNGILDDGPILPKTLVATDVLLQPPAISRHGELIAFSSVSRGILKNEDHNDFCLNVGNPSNSCADPFLVDTERRTTMLGSRAATGEQGNNASSNATLAADGSALAFESAASNLAPDDTNGVTDVFVRDLTSNTLERISVASDATQADGSSATGLGALSADRRYVVFESDADNLVSDDHNRFCRDLFDPSLASNCTDVFLHDMLTGFTERISVADDANEANGRSSQPFVSADGQTIAFESNASNLIPDGSEASCAGSSADMPQDDCSGIFISAPSAQSSADLNHDGDVSDTVLRVVDARSADEQVKVTTIGPAAVVDVAAGRAVYLSPEAEVGSGEDLNGDGDTQDRVVHLYARGDSGARNLAIAASDVALSNSWLAILVSEADQGGIDRNGDGDHADTVVCVASLAAPADCRNLRRAADQVQIAGSLVAMLTPEAMQGEDLNGDGDLADRVLAVYDPATDTLINTGYAAEEMVVGPNLIAFRTSEAKQGAVDLNGDGDHDDFVLQVFDVQSRTVINSGQAATPCRLEACDPRVPYRVLQSSVRFLTLEAEQSRDLNGDGDESDLVLQTFALSLPANLARAASLRTPLSRVTAIGAVKTGICSDNGHACVSTADCQTPATCYLPPGRCVEDLGNECRTDEPHACGSGKFCVPNGPGVGTCHAAYGSCTTDGDCALPAHCQDSGSARQQVIDPFSTADGAGFTGAGLCIEQLEPMCNDEQTCAAGQFCMKGADGSLRCHRSQGSCATQADCPIGAQCRAQLITAVARDSDGDEVPDPFDNCPRIANGDQADDDGDGVGNACAAMQPVPPSPNTGRAHESGCAIATGGSRANPWWLLLTLGFIWAQKIIAQDSWRNSYALRSYVRRRSCQVVVCVMFAVMSMMIRPATAQTSPACGAADCDGSGQVTVDEVLRLVNLALGALPISNCPCADSDGNAAVTVDELVAAVDDALNGCPEVAPAALARAVVSSLRGLIYVPNILMPISMAIAGVPPNPHPCPIAGGLFASSCSMPAANAVHIPIDIIACESDSPEGRGLFNGTVNVSGFGTCPDLLLPGNIHIRAAVEGNLRDLSSNADVDTSFDNDIFIRRFHLGLGICRLTGGEGTLNGEMRMLHRDGQDIVVKFADVSTTIGLDDFRQDLDCEPEVFSASLAGPLRISDSEAGRSMCAVAAEMNIRRERRVDLSAIDGSIASALLGGSLKIETTDKIKFQSGDLCFRGGELQITRGAQTWRLRFEDDGAVRLQGDGIDTTLSEFTCGRCGDGHRDRNEECDDNNLVSGDGCSDKCVIEPCHECTGEPSRCEMAADGSACDDGLECTGSDHCRDGACSVHSKPCVIVVDNAAARILASDLDHANARVLSDRNLLRFPLGIALEPDGGLLVGDSDADANTYALLRVDPRTGAQMPVMQSSDIIDSTALVAETGGTLLITSARCCSGNHGGAFRVDPVQHTETLLFETPAGVDWAPVDVRLLSEGEALVTYRENEGGEPQSRGHLLRVDLATGDQREIPIDTTLWHPVGVAMFGASELLVLDNGRDLNPNRLLRVDLLTGHAEDISTPEPFFYPINLIVAPDRTLLIADGAEGGGRVVHLDEPGGAAQQLIGPNRITRPQSMLVTPVCGNGIVELGETCDDGNLDDSDGCSAECRARADESIRRTQRAGDPP